MTEIAGLLPAPTESVYEGDDPFRILGVAPSASPAEVKRAYLRLARRYHPDINSAPQAKRIFARINWAYANISSRRELSELYLKCRVVRAKEEYAEGMQLLKRAKTLAGIDPQPSPGSPRQDFKTLALYLFLVCPSCEWREKCDHATRFDEIREIHNELMSKGLRKMGI